MPDAEAWKTIDGYGGRYEISSHGRLRSGGKLIRKPSLNRGGYVRYIVHADKKYTTLLAHRLVLEYFVGASPSDKHEVNHINNIRTDNRPENLEWVTRLENAQHREKFGKSAKGEGNGRAVLTWPLVRAIRGFLAQGNTQKHLASRFGVSHQMISEIHRNNFWVEEAA